MSGMNQGFMIGTGLLAAALSVFVVRRMDDAADSDRLEIRLNIVKTFGYFCWLLELNRSMFPMVREHFLVMLQHDL